MASQDTHQPPARPTPSHQLDWFHVTLLILLAVIVTVALTLWIARTYLFPSEFRPVQLNAQEQAELSAKLDRLQGLAAAPGDFREPSAGMAQLPQGRLEAERYQERDTKREISLSERELNALLARNPDMARRLAIDLSDNLISALLLVPVDPDFPILAGKIIKVRAGLELAFEQGKPVVVLRGISIMGVPLPNAWLGGLKNIDLVGEFGQQPGFWRSFAAGIEALQVQDQRLTLKLQE